MKKQAKRVLGIVLCASCVVGMLAIGGCAPQAPSAEPEPQENENSLEVAVTWAPDIDCAPCHGAEETSMGSADYLASVHEAEGKTCTDCHSDEVALSSVHEGATTASKVPERLVKTKVDDALCLECHNLDELAVATESSTVLVDSQGAVENPHSLPKSDNHDNIACSACHKMHSSVPVGTTAKNACLSCHHEDVFECGTCHEEQ